MKIAIVIPLKAKSVSNDWDTVQENLKLTLQAVANQTSNEFSALVVGHDKPEKILFEKYDNINFLKFDLQPPPKKEPGTVRNIMPFERDKFSKIIYGLCKLVESDQSITHCFALDADDLIHRDFIKTVFNKGEFQSYVIQNGYIVYKTSLLINKTNELPAFCASSAVIDIESINLPTLENLRIDNTIYWQHSHVSIPKHLIESTNCCVLKERLVMYSRENGENISEYMHLPIIKKIRRKIKAFIRSLRNSSDILKSFGHS